MRNAFGSSPQWRENLYLHLLAGESGRTSQMANIGGDQMNPEIKILPLPSVNGLFGGRMSRQRSGQLLVLRMGNCPWRQISHKLANGLKMWKGIWNTTTLLFSLNGLMKYMMILPEVKYASPTFRSPSWDCFKKNHQQGNQFQHQDVEHNNLMTSR